MQLGACYYPEQWPREMWEHDIRLMKEANFNVVRIGEFAWARLEPEPGQYDFQWLDDVIGLLDQGGIAVILGTPTATPPKWLMDKYPDIYQRDKFGGVRGYGSRRHYCVNHPVYQELTKGIVQVIAARYGHDRRIQAWQIDNEFGCQDTTYCYCDHCLQAFHVWLEQKYGSVDRLNEEWGTVFWSQTYRDWSELILPAYSVCDGADPEYHGHNPALVLDYKRFSSDAVVRYQQFQIDLIRKLSDKPITHNLMGHFPEIDYFNLAEPLDFVSWDNYIDYPWDRPSYRKTAMAHDLMRGVKKQNFWVMEHQSGPCGWNVLADTPRPGQLRLWTYQSVAHGADGIVYFRFRAARYGAEQYWYGILDHDSVPRRRYREIQQTCGELVRLAPLLEGAQVVSDIAIVKSYDHLWSHAIHPHNRNFDYTRLLQSYYDAFSAHGYNVDLVGLHGDLSSYKVVVIPAFHLSDPDLKAWVSRYVMNGGRAVLTFRSGSRNWNNAMTDQTLPGDFRELCGVEVEEFDSLNYGRQVEVQIGGSTCLASIWCDILHPNGATTLGTYAGEYYDGEAAITVNGFGQGHAYYIGCDLDEHAMRELMGSIAEASGINPLPISVQNEGVEIVRKRKDGREFYVVLNHNARAVRIPLTGECQELVSGAAVTGELVLESYAIAILRHE
ncbi:beta-galactosidase [Paenibacillus methanolicus]|uniref:Beta-galactosidase n=1 Tax=Paenibacillus methanolicus TaxID=582686 RepID=A0A5S5BY77_9BACL|nr:beta-galactosidase [Paenibacillus methanolicus]TYP71090.1 beta-galactosidase [Paenibacillus methanolicus]